MSEPIRNNADFLRELSSAIELIRSTVSPIGKVESEEERQAVIERMRTDKTFFKRTCFPHYARQAEPEYASEIQQVLTVRNQPQLLLGFRGCAKSTDVSLIDAAHEILFGTANFFIFISRSVDIAVAEYGAPLLAELRTNPVIKYYFTVEAGDPRVYTVGVKREREADFIVNGVRVLCGGIKSSYRGKKHRGRRPDRIRLEDIEDNTNRMNASLRKKYMRVIHDDIMQSVGSGKDEQWSVIFIGNYFSRQSLIHALRTTKEMNWQTTVIKALREVREGESNPHAIDGWVSTWPANYPTADLIRKRRRAPVTFEIEWQQNPTDDDSLFRRDWFPTFKRGDEPPEASLFGWIDPSPSESGVGDYKAIGVGAFTREEEDVHMHLIDCVCRRMTVNEMVQAVYELQRAHRGIRMWGYESVSAEFYLEKLIAQAHWSSKYGFSVQLSQVRKKDPNFVWKKDRIPQLQPVAEKGFIHLLQGDADTEEMLLQTLDYPDGEHDDGPDMLSGLYRLGESQMYEPEVLLI